MNQQAADALYFQACRTLDGRAERVPMAKRNHMAAVVLSPEWMDGGPVLAVTEDWFDNPKYYVNLNDIESRTWRQVLAGMSLSTIAREERVSRQAIYSRIAGTHGYGGMISKNFWVLLWWRCRRSLR